MKDSSEKSDAQTDETPDASEPTEVTPATGEVHDEPPVPEIPAPTGYIATLYDPEARAEAQALDIAGTYHYDGDSPMDHPVLGRINPGPNEYTNDLHPEAKAALQELVQAGALRRA